MKADECENELCQPASPKRFFGGCFFSAREKPKWSVTKDEGPRGEGDVARTNENTRKYRPTKIIGFLLEKLDPSLHHGISNIYYG